MSEHRREDEAEKMLLMFTTPYATCGGMRLLEFAAKFGEHEALGVLCRQYGWDATKLPFPASPAVGGEEEAAFRESVRRQIVQQFTKGGKSPALIASMDLFTTRLFDSICQRLVAPLRAEIASLKQELESWKNTHRLDTVEIAALKQERDELREGLRMIASFCPEGHVSIVPQKALQQATKICRALLASREEKKE